MAGKIKLRSTKWHKHVLIGAVIVILAILFVFYLPSPDKTVDDENGSTLSPEEFYFNLSFPNGTSVLVAASDIDPSKNEDVVVGAMLPLSGEFAKLGLAVMEGIELAVTQINEAGGINNRTFRVVYENTQCNADSGKLALSKLVALRNVPVVIGGVCAESTVAVKDIINATGTVLVSPSISNPIVMKLSSQTYSIWPPDPLQAEVMARHMDSVGLDKTAVFYVGNNYGNRLFDAFEDVYEKELGNDVVIVEAFDEGENFFKDALFRALKRDPNAIYIIHQTEGAQLVNDLHELGIDNNIFGNDAFNTPQMFNRMRDNSEGLVFTRQDYDAELERVQSFLEDYYSQFGNVTNPHEVYTANAYDAVNIIAQSIAEGSYSSGSVKKGLESLSGYEGVSGKITMGKYGIVQKSYQVIEIMDRQQVKIATY